MIKKKLVFPSGKLMSGKRSKWIWKAIRKAKTKSQLRACLFDIGYVMESIEDRLFELKDYVGEKKEL